MRRIVILLMFIGGIFITSEAFSLGPIDGWKENNAGGPRALPWAVPPPPVENMKPNGIYNTGMLNQPDVPYSRSAQCIHRTFPNNKNIKRQK